MIEQVLTDWGNMPRVFKLIALDPPWPYRVYSDKGKGRSAENHYKTMTLQDIADLPILRLADPRGALLLLWTTPPGLPDQIEIAKGWGFKYVSKAFTWVKLYPDGRDWFMGNGFWSRSNTEDCYLFRAGDIPTPKNRAIRQVIMDPAITGQLSLFPPIIAPVSQHSAKPEEFYWKAHHLVTKAAPKLELFARIRFPNWWAVGNELDRRDIRESLALISRGEYRPLDTLPQPLQGV